MTDSVDHQVREVLREVYAAWDANDADAFVKPYAGRATVTLPGMYLPGRQATHDTMEAFFAGELNGSRQDGTWMVQAFRNFPERVDRDAE